MGKFALFSVEKIHILYLCVSRMLKEAAAQLLPSSTHTTDKYRKLEPPALTFDILRVAILWHVNKSVTDTLGIKTG